ncbi:MAG: DNA gyrase subunit A [Nitrospinae bacterium]|nr:DNA gyrase subunit A [Nitrospinota bacterium]
MIKPKEKIEDVNIEDELKYAYIDYAMSVIIGRALPDVRDGLKPVHRRILYAMYNLNNDWNKPYKKSARIVGDVIGKYHPHGDVAVYDAIVRMAQEFSLRYPLIDGQGNFGSIDGDPPAAMRYTEIRMAELSQEMLSDIEKETVDFGPNYDESLTEPLILPAKIPNLLVNGSSGIAVGMSTNIPPHNLNEVMEGIIKMIDNPNITIEELMELIQGPDFPTAGFIYGREGIISAYKNGRGLIQVRARAVIERDERRDRENIIITEIPYQLNKSRLLEKIGELVREKKIEGISEIRDESNREGIRIVVGLKKGEDNQIILNKLYKQTQLQDTYGIIMLAIVNNQPRILDLKSILMNFIQYRRLIVTKRTEYELIKAKERRHILKGLEIALNNIDRIIQLIKEADTTEKASDDLIKEFNLDKVQAKAILDMRLQRLTGMERQKILDELENLKKSIKELEAILNSDDEKFRIIKEELREIQKKYGDERRTEIIDSTTEIEVEDMIAEEDVVVTVSHTGYIKRNPISLYRAQGRGGKGIKAMGVKEDDFVTELFIASTHSYILFFTNTGKIHWLKVYEVPQASRTSKGKAIVNILQLEKGERVTAMIPIREFVEGKYLVMATQRGIVKKTPLMAYSNVRVGGIIALTIDEGDMLIYVRLTDGNKRILLATKNGMAIQFEESEIRPIGRTGRGVKGITLREGDEVVGAEITDPDSTILIVTENGYGKRTDVSQYRLQSRGGIGLINIKNTERNGGVVGIKQIYDDDELMIITANGNIIRLRVKDISVIGRNTQGVKLIDIDKENKVVCIARVREEEERGEDDTIE